MKTVYIDTGPIVAILDKRDEHHIWASEKISEITTSLRTTSIIITEAFYLLRNIHGGIERLFQTLEEGYIQIEEAYPKKMNFIHQIVMKYSNINASLGDASLLSLINEKKKQSFSL